MTFNIKYGENTLEIPLSDGSIIKTDFFAKYGKNTISFPTTDNLRVDFVLKYGGTAIEIPITENTKPAFAKNKMTDLWKSKVTIFNDIPATSDSPRLFEKFVISKCQITGQLVEKANGTIRNVLNADTVITKDVEHYKSPIEYAKLPAEERADYYTVQVGDFVVFGEVDDVVTDAKEFIQLQTKYKHNGIKITSVSANINGMAVDNVMMTNA